MTTPAVTNARDYFDLSLIFNPEGNCLLCKVEGGGHRDGCPGQLFDAGGLKYIATYTTGGCNRGCCSSSDHRDEAYTREELIGMIARHDPPRYVEVVVGVSLDSIEGICGRDSGDAILEAATNPRKAAAAAAEAARKKSARDNLLMALEKERGDLNPEGYERRRAEIFARYPLEPGPR